MRRDDKYRFSLQWSADSEEKLRVGALLERLGNRKSDFIVLAVTEYLRQHPEVETGKLKIQVNYTPVRSDEELLSTIRGIAKSAVDELLAGKVITEESTQQEGPTEQDLDAMVDGLKMFDI